MTVLTRCRDAQDSEVPTTASRLANKAREQGWLVRVTYADAMVEDRRLESVLVRLRRGPLAAVGAWHNSKFALGYVWSAFSPPRRIGARDLGKFIKGADS